jgi:archaellum component FlaC
LIWDKGELSGIQGNDNISAFGRTINEIEEEIKQLEETAKGLKIGSDEFNKANIRAEQLKKQLQAVALEGEAIGLGFKGIGQAGNSIEGLETKIQQLNASFSLTSDELQKADIARQIEAIRTEVQLLEAEAKQGLFPPGSIGSLTAEAEKLEIQLRRIPVGTQEYGVIKQRLDEVNLQVGFLSSSVEDQKAVFRDLGQSAFQVFGNLSGIVGSFAGDSKEAEEAILLLQQALALTDAVVQASETARLIRSAQKATAIKAETVAINENTGATIANAGAQRAVAGGLEGGIKSTKGLGNAFQVLFNVIKANPLIAIVSVIGGDRRGRSCIVEIFQAFRRRG